MMSSSTPQSSYRPLGKNRRMMIGVFFSRSSILAISRGSVCPPSPTPTIGAPWLICRARVPSTRARSYLVMYLVVVLSLSGIRSP